MTAPAWGARGWGWLVVNGTRYDHDLVVTVAGEIVPRPKHLSRQYGGWHTALGPAEVAVALAGDPEILIVGRGYFGVLPIRAETRALLAQRAIALEATTLPRALARYDHLARTGICVAAILHLTC